MKLGNRPTIPCVSCLICSVLAYSAVTSNLNINFLRKPAAGRNLRGECRLMKVGKNLVVGEVWVYSEGMEDAVAHVTGTYSIPQV